MGRVYGFGQRGRVYGIIWDAWAPLELASPFSGEAKPPAILSPPTGRLGDTVISTILMYKP